MRDKKPSAHITVIGAIFVFLLTFLVYTPALKNDFVWDDREYVYENANIQSLNFQSIYWMVTGFHSGNWHPLTWFSHALDCTLWGLNPEKHHLINLIIHGLNTSLVFILIMALLSRGASPGKSASENLIAVGITSLLFGLHPLNVESVAWVSERKNLLCAFFLLLTLLSYLSYTSSVLRKHRLIWFTTCLLLFILALMSKPMAVTLPVTLLLLDIYPLKRLSLYLGKTGKELSVSLEKIPFFALSIASSIITIMAQHAGGALKSLEHFHLDTRLLNALRALVFYLEKIIVPVKLVPLYPFPIDFHWLDSEYLLSALLVLVITSFCLWKMKQGNYLFFIAWSYYVVTLIPVLGIIQVGGQAAADRYTYLPSISLFFLVGVGVAFWWKKISLMRFKVGFRVLLLVCLCTVVFLLSYLTINQIKVWQNPEIFWSHIISAFPKTIPKAYHGLGFAYDKKGRLDEAIAEYKRALAIDPNYAKSHYNLGIIYVNKSMFDEAISEFKKALTIDPNYVEAHCNLGIAYGSKNMFDEAISEFKKALTINPNYVEANTNLGAAYHRKGEFDKAISEYKRAIAVKPDFSVVHNNLALSYYAKGNYKLAIFHCDKAVKLGYNVNPKILELLKHYR